MRAVSFQAGAFEEPTIPMRAGPLTETTARRFPGIAIPRPSLIPATAGSITP